LWEVWSMKLTREEANKLQRVFEEHAFDGEDQMLWFRLKNYAETGKEYPEASLRPRRVEVAE